MLIFLYGENDFLSRQKLSILKEKFKREVDPGGHSLTVVDGETADLAGISSSLGPSSLFSRRRMTVVENIFQNKKIEIFGQLEKYLQSLENQDNIIVFWDTVNEKSKELIKAKKPLFDFLSSQKFSERFDAMSPAKTEIWARQAAEERGVRLTHQASAMLVGLLGADQRQISHELDKLISYQAAKSGGQAAGIEISDIENLVKGQLAENIFALTDAISGRNKALAAKLLEEQIQAGLSENYLLVMITRQFRILLSIREALDQGHTSRKIISSLKLHPFIVQKGLTQVRNFSALFLRRVYAHLVKLEYRSKTGQGDLRTGLDIMLAKM